MVLEDVEVGWKRSECELDGESFERNLQALIFMALESIAQALGVYTQYAYDIANKPSSCGDGLGPYCGPAPVHDDVSWVAISLRTPAGVAERFKSCRG